jgi:exoribonuclease-2
MSTSTGSNRSRLQAIARRAMLERGLLPEFSAAARAELAALTAAAPVDGASVRDLRDRLWCSIDNDDSRDLDQLSVAESLDGGAVRVSVAVADVDALVTCGTAIDDHARTNTTTVYTAAEIFPMLPEKLSTDLTSLGQDDDRLAMIVEMEVTPDGEVRASTVYRAAVRNRAKLAYDGVAAWLEGRAPAPERLAAVNGLDDQLRMQDRAAQAMRRRRFSHGALTLGSSDAHVVFDGDTLADVRSDQQNRAQALIEDFMIAANGVVASFLHAKGMPTLRRVLPVPARWPRIVEIARGAGGHLPAEPDAAALEAFLTDRRTADPDGFADLSLSIIKLLGSGAYAVERPGETGDGHFGLAVRDYTHSTAPNRRFPDMITQRLVKAALTGRPSPYAIDALDELARHCTEQEDDASRIERQVRKSAAALLMASRVGQRFDGIVTGASPKGTWVRLLRPAAEGKVVRGERGLDVGERVRVELVHTDVDRGFIDFARV